MTGSGGAGAASRFRGAAAWSLAGALVSRGAALTGTLVSARLVGAAGLGAFATIQSTIALVGVFAGLGLATATARFVSHHRATDPSRAAASVRASLAMSLVIGLAIAAAMLPVVPVIAGYVLGAPALAAAVRYSLPLIPAGAVLGVLTGALLGYEDFRSWTLFTAFRGVLGGAGSVLGARAAGVAGMTAGFAIAEVVSTLAFGVRVRRAHGWRHPFDRQLTAREARPALAFGLPTMLGSVAVSPALWLGRILLVHQPSGFAEAGLFDAANRWGSLVLFIPTSIAPVQLPLLANLRAAGDVAGFRRVIREMVTIGMASCAVPSLLLAAGAPWCMALYGPAFRRGWPVLLVILLATLPNAMNTLLGQALISIGAVWRRLAWDCLLAALFAGGAAWLIAPLGALGFATALLIGYAVVAVLLALDVRRRGMDASPQPGWIR